MLDDPASPRVYAEAAERVGQMFASSAWQAMAMSAAGKRGDGRAGHRDRCDPIRYRRPPTCTPAQASRTGRRAFSEGTLRERPLRSVRSSTDQAAKERSMSELITTGIWRVRPGREAEFIQEWTRFTQWASAMPGSATLRLGCDLGDPQRYVSFAAWDNAEAAHAWKQSPEFRDKIAQVLQHVDAFEPAELSVVAVVQATAETAIA
jgi:heme-degrading monooxygenase HmoA